MIGYCIMMKSIKKYIFFLFCMYAAPLNPMYSPGTQGTNLANYGMNDLFKASSTPSPIQYGGPPIIINGGGLGGNHSNSTDFGIFAPFASFLAGHPLLSATVIFGGLLWKSEKFQGMVQGWVLTLAGQKAFDNFIDWGRSFYGGDKKTLAKQEGATEQALKTLKEDKLELQNKIKELEEKNNQYTEINTILKLTSKEVDSLKQELLNKQKDLDFLRKDKEEVAKKQIESSMNVLNATKQCEIAENYNKRLEDEKNKLRLELEQKKGEHAKAIAELANLQGFCKGLENQLSDYRKREESYRQQVSPNTPLIQEAGGFSSKSKLYYTNTKQRKGVQPLAFSNSNFTNCDIFSVNKKNEFQEVGTFVMELGDQDNSTAVFPLLDKPRQLGSNS